MLPLDGVERHALPYPIVLNGFKNIGFFLVLLSKGISEIIGTCILAYIIRHYIPSKMCYLMSKTLSFIKHGI